MDQNAAGSTGGVFKARCLGGGLLTVTASIGIACAEAKETRACIWILPTTPTSACPLIGEDRK